MPYRRREGLFHRIMAELTFTQDASTKLWEAEAEVEGLSDLRVVQAVGNPPQRNTVSLYWKGDDDDEGYAAIEGSLAMPQNGIYNTIIESQYYPVYIKVVTTSEPTSARLTLRE